MPVRVRKYTASAIMAYPQVYTFIIKHRKQIIYIKNNPFSFKNILFHIAFIYKYKYYNILNNLTLCVCITSLYFFVNFCIFTFVQVVQKCTFLHLFAQIKHIASILRERFYNNFNCLHPNSAYRYGKKFHNS